jgi:hypothetical protein
MSDPIDKALVWIPGSDLKLRKEIAGYVVRAFLTSAAESPEVVERIVEAIVEHGPEWDHVGRAKAAILALAEGL